MRFLRKGYREIGRPGKGIFRSLDGLRQFRIDPRSLEGIHKPFRPYVHLEYFNKGNKYPASVNHIIFRD